MSNTDTPAATAASGEAHAYADFRRELEDFARSACPPEIRAVVAAGQKITKREYLGWQKILTARGWLKPPTAFPVPGRIGPEAISRILPLYSKLLQMEANATTS